MSEAERLNDVLEAGWPAAARCLSERGRALVFPRGIPFQSAQAKHTRLNATIGQVTDGSGMPLAPQTLAQLVPELERRACFLYSPIDGHASLRQAWRRRQLEQAGLPADHPGTLQVVTHGLTQGISMVAQAFAGRGTEVIVSNPRWGNYDLIFGQHGARITTYDFYDGDGFNVQGLADALAKTTGPAVVVLNLPNNPTGFTPTAADAEAITNVLVTHPGPAVVVFDDAYQGMVWEPGLLTTSLYWEVARRADPQRLLPIKVDGVTKELLFFPARVGFLSTPLQGEVAAALTSKLKCIARGSVGSPPGPSQAMVLTALDDPALEAELAQRRRVLAARYRTLKKATTGLSGPVAALPYNAGCFAVLAVDPSIDLDGLRHALIDDHDVGVIALASANVLRIAYCSVAEADLAELVGRVDQAARALAG